VQLDDDWEWRRWQLVRVDQEGGQVKVDAIELLDDSLDGLDESGGLVTLSFSSDAMEPNQEGPLAPIFERWVVRESGLCDAFYRPTAAAGFMVMFQGPESVVVPVSAGR
jgi:hypothetical protein